MLLPWRFTWTTGMTLDGVIGLPCRSPQSGRTSTLEICTAHRYTHRSSSSMGRSIHSGIHRQDRKSTRLNSSHGYISYAVFCLKKKKSVGLTVALLQCLIVQDYRVIVQV